MGCGVRLERVFASGTPPCGPERRAALDRRGHRGG